MGSSIKEEAKRIIDALPDDTSWEDIMYRMRVRQKVERGLKDIQEGRTVSVEELEAKYGTEE